MRKPVIAGNWKMNMTCTEAIEYMRVLIPLLKEIPKKDREVVIAPPFTALYPLSEFIKDRREYLSLSSQNVHWEDSGAYTAEVSPLMLNELSVKCAIVGHSEPRKYFSESDEQINKRAKSAQDHQLIPIVCVGETFQQREMGEAERVIRRQIEQGLEGIDVKRLIVAYEPIWAIGTGLVPSDDDIEQVVKHIRSHFSQTVKVLYGGSVKGENASNLLNNLDIDGVLVGGASLNPQEFAKIAQSC